MPILNRLLESFHNLRTLSGEIVSLVRIVLEIEQADRGLVPDVHVAVFRRVLARVTHE